MSPFEFIKTSIVFNGDVEKIFRVKKVTAGQVSCLLEMEGTRKHKVQDLWFHLQQPLKKSWEAEM